MNDKKATAPVKGHAIVKEGQAYNADGSNIHYDGWGTAGQGHGKCECGAVSPGSGGRKYRREWHRQHKVEVREADQ